ncbi:MAG: heme A synthase, partial [Streptomyces sp.]
GYAQYLTELPEILVGLHLLGSALVWVAVLRLLLSLRERGLPAGTTAPSTDRARLPAPAQSAPDQPATAASNR